MAGKGGGAWKVAYADFVTAMMAFFMVMWLTAQSSDVKTAVAEHFRNPGGRRFAGSEAKSLVTSNNVGQGSRRVVKSKGSKKTENEARVRKMTDGGTFQHREDRPVRTQFRSVGRCRAKGIARVHA